ncbi:class I SAM-dependent methyltransferase [Serpentinimonas maccroryi]|uniref:class I SAM-dependent methyltransferase n=1 Tax=Serpentinimonas maccroryi TaxID=1458426 RepID=UPI0020347EA0|nr:SAM-dependent methyltransferase [Serpentinimonas maccroryi]MCM2479310.1 SAM-dependent methyltransferase [Serpentinimonas maccroryi]
MSPPPHTPDPLLSGQSIELLQHLHIVTRDGRLNQDSRRKLKQVQHLLHFIEPLLLDVLQRRGDVTLVDHGCGKSYLGFLLYDRFFKARSQGRVIGVEARVELVHSAQALAQRLGFARMGFVAATVQQALQAELAPVVDVVTALHACDTATDDAIAFALAHRAQHLVLVPCCQAEVAAALRQYKGLSAAAPQPRAPLSELWRHALHTREFGSHLTNVLRCLQLEAHGYQVTVTELVGWEHSLKNELILARKVGPPRAQARQRLLQVLEQFNLPPLQQRFGVPAPGHSTAAA